jgi:hypothetical protein
MELDGRSQSPLWGQAPFSPAVAQPPPYSKPVCKPPCHDRPACPPVCCPPVLLRCRSAGSVRAAGCAAKPARLPVAPAHPDADPGTRRASRRTRRRDNTAATCACARARADGDGKPAARPVISAIGSALSEPEADGHRQHGPEHCFGPTRADAFARGNCRTDTLVDSCAGRTRRPAFHPAVHSSAATTAACARWASRRSGRP